MLERVKEAIKQDEGLRLKPYICSAGKTTIGYGWNLDDNPIPEEVADLLFDLSFSQAKKDAVTFIGPMAWSQLSDKRQGVLINMAFNLGINRLRGFKRFRHYVQQGDYDKAANEMVNSRWYAQVRARAERLENEMREG